MCFPPSPSAVHCPEQCGQDKWHHTPVSLSGDRSQDESCKCLLRKSLLTPLLTQTALIPETTPPPCSYAFQIPAFAWLFFFISLLFLHSSSPGSGHCSVGHPQVIPNWSTGSTSLISQPAHGILATFFSLGGEGPSCSLMLSSHDFHWSPR